MPLDIFIKFTQTEKTIFNVLSIQTTSCFFETQKLFVNIFFVQCLQIHTILSHICSFIYFVNNYYNLKKQMTEAMNTHHSTKAVPS